MSTIPSNIRVFVKFKENTIFAGENIECTITFRNLERPKSQPQPSLPPRTKALTRPLPDAPDHPRLARGPSRPALSTTQASIVSKADSAANGSQVHRHAASLNVVDTAWKDQGLAPLNTSTQTADSGGRRKHERTISIVSLESDGEMQKMRTLASGAPSQRPGFKHGRSASVQYPPSSYRSARPQSIGGPRSIGQRSPLVDSTVSPSFPHIPESPLSSRRPSEINVPASATSSSPRKTRPSPATPSFFKFPPAPTPRAPDVLVEGTKTSTQLPIRSRSPRSLNGKLNAPNDSVATAPRVFSVQSMEGTPRSSTEIYSASNLSDETLASELPSQPTGRLLQRPFLGRAPSTQAKPQRNQTETLMMGYVQIQGSFTLDGSLVNQAPFEEVKRKAVVGGQGGGGVVGIAKSTETSGLFGSFSWGSISQSIGGLLGGGELSSIKEMKGIADSRSVPLLSTSKSILFVDLRLAPGQSRSYNYRFKLPRGLPPTHAGRAMKVAYKLVVGTQRPSRQKGQQQQIKQVELPFRVLGSVNTLGEPLGHDLMSPYIILKDQAQVKAMDIETLSQEYSAKTSNRKLSVIPDAASSADDFRTYVDNLLTRPRRDSSFGLLSPTAGIDTSEAPGEIYRTLSGESGGTSPLTERTTSATKVTPSPRALIEQAIRSSLYPTSPSHTPTCFTIARASVPIATLTLSRPALKLGDHLIISIDFSAARLPCYAIEATLESVERIDPTLAIRSTQSVERVTRKIWARAVENCQWAKRTTLAWQVPASATPGFGTTGVGLDWCVRLEIVVAPRSVGYEEVSGLSEEEEDDDDGQEEDDDEDDHDHERDEPKQVDASSDVRPTRELSRLENGAQKAERMLQSLRDDERGTVYAAVSHLMCESFEVTIPIRVYGAIIGGTEHDSTDEGLPI